MYCFSILLSGLGNANVPVVFEPQTGSKSIKKGHSYRTHVVLIIVVFLEGVLSVQSLLDMILYLGKPGRIHENPLELIRVLGSWQAQN